MNRLNRRAFLEVTTAATAGALCPCALFSAEVGAEAARHFPAEAVPKSDEALPQGKRLSFGWKAVPLGAAPDSVVTLRWPLESAAEKATRLRISIALDMREAATVEASLAQSGRTIGMFDIRFGSVFQPYEIPLAPGYAGALAREGAVLRRVTGQQNIWIWTGGEGCPVELRPHLLVPGTRPIMDEFFARMGSLASVQQFGWMEGCVLDGLLDLFESAAHPEMKEAARQHLALFFRDDRLVYENHVSAPSDGRIYGIEGTAPFAALGRLEPRNSLLELPLKFWRANQDAAGAIIDGKSTTSEGAYTVGYPLAIIAKSRNDEALQQLALTQIRIRQARLFDGRTFWRTSDAGGGRGNRLWARGIAWQLLGTARTLRELKHRSDIADLITGFQQLAAVAQSFQRPDGLWSVFVDQPTLTPDTGGSAGIAAALAVGAQQGWLGNDARTAAAKALAGLKQNLTPDGFLGGVSQSNKGGEPLQRGSYRVIYQMGMGLMGQLVAALDSPPRG